MKKNLNRVLNLLLVLGFAFTYWIPSVTHEFSTLFEYNSRHDNRVFHSDKPKNVPRWQTSDEATGCKPKQFDGFQNVLVVTQGNDREVMDFEAAWRAVGDDEPANDVWVIGYCL